MTAGRVAQTRAASIRPASLDAEVGGDDSNTFGDIIEDERAEAPFLGLESRVLRQIMHEMVATLSARERQILNARFGLDGSAPQTLEEVGLTLGVTRERVRQIQDKCLRKLREQMKKMDLQGQPALLREEERVAA